VRRSLGLTGWRPQQTAEAVSIVVEDPLRGIVQVVELSVAHRPEEEHHEDEPQSESDRDQEAQRVHECLRIRASTRDAPQTTIPLESGMRTAAIRGLMRPAAAAETAVTL